VAMADLVQQDDKKSYTNKKNKTDKNKTDKNNTQQTPTIIQTHIQ
jgi:hypothetical protein